MRGFLAIKVLSCREMNAGQSIAPGHKKTEMPCHGAGIDMAELRPWIDMAELCTETGMAELRPWTDMAELCTETGMAELRSWTDMAELRPETGMEELRSWIDMAELRSETGLEEVRSGKARRGCTT
ncbi:MULTISPECIES: hypothetical protein [unclassified Anaerobiospirillum]|uniref:hypothetical protein n=1 Tax=unclassified Anaerobiospirillum TaxID=2647410 RepID=UPI001FF63B51|nr:MULTISPECIES: hypothetical protein [unclassified Anaerobiospirillum]MCK0534368.1 hypothetical protein [Anaerobiospirillum sp. NML120511]MCK0539688.1 hypothetical protein [Anaerobiospirillum sp. NML02-A-032]